MSQSKFIVFEGPDGSGQTTQASLLADVLTKSSKKVYLTKEPADDLDDGLIRKILKKRKLTSPETLQLYFTANRAHHLSAQIEPALNSGQWVISDRYFFSTLAFGMLKLDYEWLWQINSHFRKPDITFFLDVPARVCMDRLQRRGGEREFFEQEKKLEQVIKNYKEVFSKKQFSNIFIINGDRDIGIIAKEIWGIVNARLK
ncbi:dTMP kinase [Candidatus Falkowbacteria bacterium]|nr:dTMP kinase [Candidatus Falkowbacteria bacterium]